MSLGSDGLWSPIADDQMATAGKAVSFNLFSSAKMKKQERSYWCGPASASVIAWNDPSVGGSVSHSQTTWAGYLGTTTSGTSISNMVAKINQYSTGFKNRVNTYAAFSIASWNTTQWASRLNTTVIGYRAPIILHPKLTSSNASYIPAGWNTGGHFNVAQGLTTVDGAITAVLIFEPYAADGSIPLRVSQSVTAVRTQNLANTFQNIGY